MEVFSSSDMWVSEDTALSVTQLGEGLLLGLLLDPSSLAPELQFLSIYTCLCFDGPIEAQVRSLGFCWPTAPSLPVMAPSARRHGLKPLGIRVCSVLTSSQQPDWDEYSFVR